jgi:hypothetical protein
MERINEGALQGKAGEDMGLLNVIRKLRLRQQCRQPLSPRYQIVLIWEKERRKREEEKKNLRACCKIAATSEAG